VPVVVSVGGGGCTLKQGSGAGVSCRAFVVVLFYYGFTQLDLVKRLLKNYAIDQAPTNAGGACKIKKVIKEVLSFS
jgi:hypothetical protein